MNELPEVSAWLSEQELASIATSSYWNDEETERKKPWNVESEDDPRLFQYLRGTTRLESAFRELLAFAAGRGHPTGESVLDLAAGVCWTSAILAAEPGVASVVALEISKHRLCKLAPHVIRMFRAPEGKIQRVLGPFYSVKLADASVDTVVLCEALHHAFEVDRLLDEVHRVLRPKGTLLISGEQPVPFREHVRAALRTFRRIPTLTLGFRRLFPPDPELGDHYYRVGDYERMLRKHGFRVHPQRLGYSLYGDGREGWNFLGVKEGA